MQHAISFGMFIAYYYYRVTSNGHKHISYMRAESDLSRNDAAHATRYATREDAERALAVVNEDQRYARILSTHIQEIQ